MCVFLDIGVTIVLVVLVINTCLKTYLTFLPDHFPHNCCLHLVLYTVHTVV